jgi:phosphate-selective porin OprO/OprP
VRHAKYEEYDMARRFFRIRAKIALAVLAAVLVASRAARAEDGGTATDHERRIRELEQEIHELKKDTRTLTAAEDTRAAAKPIAGYQDGFFIQNPEGSYKLNVGGYTHFDGRYFIENENRSDPTTFLFRRARLDIRGTVAKYFNFRLLPDFAGSSLVLQDAYVDARYWREIAIRAGKYKVPYGIERLQSATAIRFVERALPDQLVPNRDLGASLFGELFLGALTYEVGIFNGVVDGGSGDTDLGDEKDFAGRIFATPFKNTTIEPLRGFGIGFATTYGSENDTPGSPNLPTFRTAGRSAFFRYVQDSPATAGGTAVADGAHYRFSPQGNFYWGPFGMYWEYNISRQNVELGAVEDLIDNRAWQVAASWVLTGEKNSYGPVVPSQPFNPFARRWGAFELAARYDELDVDHDAFRLGFADLKRSAKKAQEFGVGVNWYLNNNIKLVLDFDHTWFDRGEGSGDKDTENVFLSRVQLVI